ncbi:MAG: TAXI family TRAP transporter solute-binding subunit [Lachnospiraceae bacterium]|nr:TAXI family TRAP transporter solute-binding subunit [Lachnospiraceae bacterium]
MKIRIDSNWIYIILLTALIGVSVSNNTAVSLSGYSTDNLSIVSGNSGGTYYYIAAGQAKILSDTINGLQVTTQSTSGSPTENMTLVEQNPSTLGIVTVDGFYYAQQGDKERGFDHPIPGLRAILVGHTAYLYGLSLADSGIATYEDMVGKRISVPPVGSTTYYMALAIINAYGGNEANSKIIPMSSSEQADALKDGTVDVAFMAGGIPQATVTDLDYAVNLKFLSLDNAMIANLEAEYPFWKSRSIKAKTYSKQSEDMHCLTVNTLLACNEALDADVVYEITKVLNEKVDELAGIHSSGKEWNRETTEEYLDNDFLIFHEGAKRYYDEVRK